MEIETIKPKIRREELSMLTQLCARAFPNLVAARTAREDARPTTYILTEQTNGGGTPPLQNQGGKYE